MVGQTKFLFKENPVGYISNDLRCEMVGMDGGAVFSSKVLGSLGKLRPLSRMLDMFSTNQTGHHLSTLPETNSQRP